MATKIYLATTPAEYTFPFSGGWTVTGGARRFDCFPYHSASALTTYASASNSAVANCLIAQFVSPPLSAQIISGIATGVSGQVLGSESHTGVNGGPLIGIRVFSPAGTQRGIVLPITGNGAGAAYSKSPWEYGTSLANRFTPSGMVGATRAVTVQEGDLLVIELGGQQTAASTNRTFSQRYGDNGTADLAVDQTSTNTTQNPWVSFRQNLTWLKSSTTQGLARIGRKTLTPEILWYQFAGTDTTLIDSSTSGVNSGILSNVACRYGYQNVYAFSGDATNYATSTQTIGFPTPTVAVSFWLKQAAPDTSRTLLELGPNTVTTADSFAIYTDDNGSNTLCFAHSSNGCRLESISGQADNQWHHYACIFDNTVVTGLCTVYRDGLAVPTTLYSVNSHTQTGNFDTQTLNLFQRAGAADALPANTLVSDLRIYDGVLNPSEVANIYALGSHPVDVSQALTNTQTTNGVARIQVTSHQDVAGCANILVRTSSTQAGRAAIAAPTLIKAQPQTGLGRIVKTLGNNQAAKSRILKTSGYPITCVSRILRSPNTSETGKARLTKSSVKTTQGVGRVQKTSIVNQSSVARVVRSTLSNQNGLARIRVGILKNQSGKASIRQILSQSLSGIGRLLLARKSTTIALARLTASLSNSQTGKAQISSPVTQGSWQVGKACITRTLGQTQNGYSRIIRSNVSQIYGVAYIAGVVTKSRQQSGLSRLQAMQVQSTTGKAKIYILQQKQTTGLSRLLTSSSRGQTGAARIKNTYFASTLGKAYIQVTHRNGLLGMARLLRTSQRGQSGLAAIFKRTVRQISGLAYIFALRPISSITGKARISNPRTAGVVYQIDLLTEATSIVKQAHKVDRQMMTNSGIFAELREDMKNFNGTPTIHAEVARAVTVSASKETKLTVTLKV